MQVFKRYILYIAIILLIISVYKDLSLGTNQQQQNMSNASIDYSTNQSNKNYSIIRAKVQSGDTVLSVVEAINEHNQTSLDPQNILTDFIELNPTSDPYHLKIGEWYYFPIYE